MPDPMQSAPFPPGAATPDLSIVKSRPRRIAARRIAPSVEKVGHVGHPYARRDEWFDIYLCRGLKTDLRQLWPELKSFN